MEVFGQCYEAPFRDRLYPTVEEMQEVLGRTNDSRVAIQRLTQLRDRMRAAQPEEWKKAAQVESLLKYHQRRLPTERDRFHDWKQAWDSMQPAKLVSETCLNP